MIIPIKNPPIPIVFRASQPLRPMETIKNYSPNEIGAQPLKPTVKTDTVGNKLDIYA